MALQLSPVNMEGETVQVPCMHDVVQRRENRLVGNIAEETKRSSFSTGIQSLGTTSEKLENVILLVAMRRSKRGIKTRRGEGSRGNGVISLRPTRNKATSSDKKIGMLEKFPST